MSVLQLGFRGATAMTARETTMLTLRGLLRGAGILAGSAIGHSL
jgi:hypothetical protein